MVEFAGIAIVARNRVIGDGKDQPFKYPEDFARFKRLTMGCPIIMGRKTYQTVGVLPGRLSIIVTSRPETVAANSSVLVAGSVEQAMKIAGEQTTSTVWVVGGGTIYEQFMPFMSRLELTEVPFDAAGETVFPKIDENVWRKTCVEEHEQFSFVTYKKKF